jgi:hypothetical protein
MAMIGKVRRMHRCEKRSIREIARATSLSRNTIRKWLKRRLMGSRSIVHGAQPCSRGRMNRSRTVPSSQFVQGRFEGPTRLAHREARA